MAYVERPYKHVVTVVAKSGTIHLVTRGTYATCAAAVQAAKKAERARPDETREIRLRNRTYRNRYAHGPVVAWPEND